MSTRDPGMFMCFDEFGPWPPIRPMDVVPLLQEIANEEARKSIDPLLLTMMTINEERWSQDCPIEKMMSQVKGLALRPGMSLLSGGMLVEYDGQQFLVNDQMCYDIMKILRP